MQAGGKEVAEIRARLGPRHIDIVPAMKLSSYEVPVQSYKG